LWADHNDFSWLLHLQNSSFKIGKRLKALSRQTTSNLKDITVATGEKANFYQIWTIENGATFAPPQIPLDTLPGPVIFDNDL
jgi:hypothetical protein